MRKLNLIIDFDSTFIKTEALEELSKIIFKNNPAKEKIIKEIEKITQLGMEGKITFTQSLTSRLKILSPEKKHINLLIKKLKNQISKSAIANRQNFAEFSQSIFLISGGFADYILPVVKDFGIPNSHIFANTFVYDKNGSIKSPDLKNPLTTSEGKYQVVKNKKLSGKTIVIGDGFTDYLIKEKGAADEFWLFTENVLRKNLLPKANRVIKSFDEFFTLVKSDKI